MEFHLICVFIYRNTAWSDSGSRHKASNFIFLRLYFDDAPRIPKHIATAPRLSPRFRLLFSRWLFLPPTRDFSMRGIKVRLGYESFL